MDRADSLGSDMFGRLVLTMTVWPADVQTSGIVRLTDADSEQPLRVRRGSFVLTLEREPEGSFARGHLRSTTDGGVYPIQTTMRLFDALQAYITEAR